MTCEKSDESNYYFLTASKCLKIKEETVVFLLNLGVKILSLFQNRARNVQHIRQNHTTALHSEKCHAFKRIARFKKRNKLVGLKNRTVEYKNSHKYQIILLQRILY